MNQDTLVVAAIAALCVVAVGFIGQVALLRLRGRGLATLLTVMGCTALAAVVAAVAVSTQAMFLSAHDAVVVAVTLGAATPLAVVLALWLARQVRWSVRSLIATAQSLGDDSLPVASPRGPMVSRELAVVHEELTAAGRALRQAKQAEQAMDASRREVMAWLSHDLRTPLAGIRAMAEALEDGVVEDPTQYYRQLRVEAERLSTMVDSLFLVSRLQAGALPPERQLVDIADLVSDAVASVTPLARSHQVGVCGEGGSGLLAQVDPSQISRAVVNVLANGVRHTPAGGRVEVTVLCGEGEIRIAVQDGCGGIPGDELPRVFDVAWRGRAARSSGPDGGGGLGLAIVQGVVTAHGGSVAVRNVGPGCRIEICLPVPVSFEGTVQTL
ncbi:MAG: sensor histidine kinase [Actinomycetota bacterium]